MMEAAYFPEEIILEILLRLSVKSLIRFRGVCKSWNSLITSLAFIDSHLSQSIRNSNSNPPPRAPLIFRYGTPQRAPLPLVFSRHRTHKYINKEQHFEDLFKLFHDNEECTELAFPMKSRRGHRFIGSENGLICLCKALDFSLWNPSIRKVVNLPKPCIRDFYSFRDGEVKKLWYTFVVGFGFDSRTNDYMVVRIACPYHREVEGEGEGEDDEEEEEDDEFWRKTILVEVYSLSTGSWRISNAGFPPSTHLTDSNFCSWSKPSTCLNGCVHFTADYFVAAAGDNVSYASVLALDLRDDVFREMMPKDMIRLELRIDEIDTRIYRGSLALLHYNTNRNQTQERYCFIWVMKEYGVVDSWVKQFTIDLNVHWNVLGFTKNCQPILTIGGQSWECELSSLDSKSQQVTKLGMHGDGEDRTICVDTYRENLVLLKTEPCLTQSKRCRSQMESGQEDEEDHKEEKKYVKRCSCSSQEETGLLSLN